MSDLEREIAELALLLLIAVIGVTLGFLTSFHSGILWGVGVAIAVIFFGAVFDYILFQYLLS